MGDRPQDGSARGIDRALLLLAVLGGVAARLLLPGSRVFSDPSIAFVDGDPYYQLRRIQYVVKHFPAIFDFDSFVNYPDGAPIIWPHGFALLLGAGARMLPYSASRTSVEFLCAAAIPLLGAATILAVYGLGRATLSRPGAGAAALAFALLPSPVIYGLFGHVDHHVMEPLLLALAGAACLDAFRRPLPSSIAMGVLAGALASLSCWFVTDGIVIVILIGVLAAWAAVFQGSPNARLTALATILAETITLITLASRTPWGLTGTMTYLALSPFQAHLAVAGLGLSTAIILGTWTGARGGARVLGVVAGIALAAAAIGHGGRELLEPLRAASRFLSATENLESTVREGTALWKMPLSIVALRISPFGLVAPVILILAALRERREIAGLAALLGLGVFALGVVQSRFMVLGAVGIAWAAGWVTARAFRFSFSRPAPSRLGWAAVALVVANAALPYLWIRPDRIIDTAEHETQGALADAARPFRDPSSSLDRPDRPPRWGVLAPWALGHLLVYRAGLPVVASPFGQAPWHVAAVRRVARFNFSDSDAAAADLCRRLRVRYVVTRDPLVSAVNDSRVLGLPLDRYLRFDREGGDTTSLTPFFLRTASFRLHALDGRRATLPGAELPALPSFRLLWEAERLAAAGLPGYGMPPGTRDSYYKLFEVVAGARVEGRCRPGEAVRLIAPVWTNTGRRFDWTNETPCGSSGAYALRTPYPGDALRVTSGGRERRIAVTLDEVRAGSVVRADLEANAGSVGAGGAR